MQGVLSEAACQAAGVYFAKKRRAGRRALMLAAGVFAFGLALVAVLHPPIGVRAAACGSALLCALLVQDPLLRRRRRAAPGTDYVDTVRPVLARELYPDCTFALLGTPHEMALRLQDASVWAIGGELTEYGGSLCLQTPAGTVYAHDFTENCYPRDSDNTKMTDWVVYELALPAASPWRGAGYAQIRRGRTRAPRHFAAAVQHALHHAPQLGENGLPEKRIEGTPLVLCATDTTYYEAALRRVGAQVYERFFQTCGSGNIVCFCGGKLYVFAHGQRLDQRWSDSSRLEPEAVSRNAAAVERTIHAVSQLV